MSDDVTIRLPPHAVRYLRTMLEREHRRVANHAHRYGYSLQHEAAYDSLNVISEVLPDEPTTKSS